MVILMKDKPRGSFPGMFSNTQFAEKGSVMLLVLILGMAVTILSLGLMRFAGVEVQTVEKYQLARHLHYVTESGLEYGIAVLNAYPSHRQTVEGFLVPEEPAAGSFQISFYDRGSDWDDEKSLPRGYDHLDQLSAHEVLLKSQGVVNYKGEERWLTLWALAEHNPLYNKALLGNELLHFKELTGQEGINIESSAIYGNVHAGRRLLVEFPGKDSRTFIHKPAGYFEMPLLTYSTPVPLEPMSIWSGETLNTKLFVEVSEGTPGSIFIPGIESGDPGRYYLTYPEPGCTGNTPESAGFTQIPPLIFDYEIFKEELLARVKAKDGEGSVKERFGDEIWTNENIHQFNQEVTRVHGNLTLENTWDAENHTMLPLYFEGVIIVEGTLSFRLHNLPEGMGEVETGSKQNYRGIIMADEIDFIYENVPDPASNNSPGDKSCTWWEMEGLLIARHGLNMGNIIENGETENGDLVVQENHSVLWGTALADKIILQGEHTQVYHADVTSLIPEYKEFLPARGYYLRQLFKPYAMQP